MKTLGLLVIYLLVGAGAAAALLLTRRREEVQLLDLLLLLLLWPVYGPFLLARLQGEDDGIAQSEIDFLVALRRARSTPLAVFLPDETTLRQLAQRLRTASQRLDEIDALLKRPEFDEADALQRLDVLNLSTASERAISTARLRLANIRRMRGMRERTARELEEVGELLTQLRTQVEVVRLSGAPDDETRGLVEELLVRVQSLDGALGVNGEDVLMSDAA